MATIAELNVALTATTQNFEQGIKAARSALGELQKVVAQQTSGRGMGLDQADAAEAAARSARAFESGVSGAQAMGGSLGRVANLAGGAREAMQALSSPLGMAGIAFGAAGGAAAMFVHNLRDVTSENRQYLDGIRQQSEALSTSIASLQAYGRAALESATSQEAADRALTTLNLKIGQAVDGSESATAAFERLGLSTTQLNGQDLVNNFGAVADAINRLPTPSERAAAAQEIFGKNYAQVMRLIQGGSGAIEAASASLGNFSSVTTVVASEIKRLGDEHQRVMEDIKARDASTVGQATIIWTAFTDRLGETWQRMKQNAAVMLAGGRVNEWQGGMLTAQGEEALARNMAAERQREAEAQAAAAAEQARVESRKKSLAELAELAKQFDAQAAAARGGSEQAKLGALAEQIGGGNPAEMQAAINALERLNSIKKQIEQQKQFDSTREAVEQQIAAVGLSRAQAEKLKLEEMELTSQQREQLSLLYDQLDARQKAADQAKQLADEHERLEDSLANQLLTLQAEVAAQGQGSNQVAIEKLRLQGASAEQLARLQVLADQIEAMEARTKRDKDAERGGRRGRELAGLPPLVEAPSTSGEAFVRLLANTRLLGERPTPGEQLIVAELKAMNRLLGAPAAEPIVAEF